MMLRHFTSFSKKKRDIEGEGAYAEAEDLISNLTHGGESLFKMELFFLIKGESLEEVNRKVISLKRFMGLKGVKLFLEGNKISEERIKSAIRTAVIEKNFIPVLFIFIEIKGVNSKITFISFLKASECFQSRLQRLFPSWSVL